MQHDIVFLHGWGQHSDAWAPLTAQLGAHTHCFDLPGHGGDNSSAQAWQLDALVDAYAARAPAPCHVVGWSLGGQIALRWAQRHPTQVAKLVLIATTPCFGVRSDWPHGTPVTIQEAFAAQIAADPAQGLLRFADLLASGEADVRGTRRILRQLLADSRTPSVTTLLAGLNFLATTDLRAALREAPPAQATLLVHGAQDTITPLAASQWLAQTLPHTQLLALDHCGHAPMLSHSAAVAAAIQKFLDE